MISPNSLGLLVRVIVIRMLVHVTLRLGYFVPLRQDENRFDTEDKLLLRAFPTIASVETNHSTS